MTATEDEVGEVQIQWDQPLAPPVDPGYVPHVIEALALVMADVQSVAKTGSYDDNKRGVHYSFRGVDAVMDAVGPAFRSHGLVCLPHKHKKEYSEVITQGQNKASKVKLTVKYRVYGPRGKKDWVPVEVSSEAFDTSDKGTAKAWSVAYRTALIQALTLPTGDPDPDDTRLTLSNVSEAAGPVANGPKSREDTLEAIRSESEELRLIRNQSLEQKVAGWIKYLTSPEFLGLADVVDETGNVKWDQVPTAKLVIMYREIHRILIAARTNESPV